LRIFSQLTQPLSVPAAWLYGHPVVTAPVEYANGAVTHLIFFEKRPIATGWIKRQIGGKFDIWRAYIRWNRFMLERNAATPPFENPMIAIREGSMRGCLDSSSSAW